jgi:D-threo-aldose 1-dehydrogenase
VSPTREQQAVRAGRPLGSTGLVPSALAFGGAPLGGLYETVSDDEAERTVKRALELGLRYLDTAPHYGLGVSEWRLGRALRGVPRDSYLLSTKVGRLLRPLAPGETAPDEGFAVGLPLKRVRDYSRDGIVRSVQESLERLGLDRIDVLYLHDPDDFESEVYQTGYPALAQLRSEGVVGAIGAGMNQAAMLERFVRRLDLDVVLLAGRYSLLDQSALDALLPACLEREVGVVIGGALNSGLLANPRPGARYDYGEAPAELIDRAAKMNEVCSRHGVSLVAAALQFPLGHPAVASVLVGARSEREVDQNAGAFNTPVPRQVWEELRASGLLADGIPVPDEPPSQ